MELWIRSQDKRHLIKADYVSIMENNIINVASSGWDYDVAKYKSEERALEVLDEIENILKIKNMYEYDRELVLKCWQNFKEEQVEIVRGQMSVYEMPRE